VTNKWRISEPQIKSFPTQSTTPGFFHFLCGSLGMGQRKAQLVSGTKCISQIPWPDRTPSVLLGLGKWGPRSPRQVGIEGGVEAVPIQQWDRVITISRFQRRRRMKTSEKRGRVCRERSLRKGGGPNGDWLQLREKLLSIRSSSLMESRIGGNCLFTGGNKITSKAWLKKSPPMSNTTREAGKPSGRGVPWKRNN